MSAVYAVIQGLIGGAGEFLPVSASGHLAVLRNLFNVTGGQAHPMLDGLIHMGTVIAMIFVFRKDIKAMLGGTSALIHGRKPSNTDVSAARLLLLLFAASIPMLLLIPVGKYITAISSRTVFVGAMLVLNGFVLALYPKFVVSETKNERSMSFSGALVTGLCQCAAVLPGLSRTAVVMTACAASGMSRGFSVKFALLCSIPAMFGTALYEIITAASYGIVLSDVPLYILGMVSAMIISVPAIGLMNMLSKRKSFGGFAYYCQLAGVLTVILSTIF